MLLKPCLIITHSCQTILTIVTIICTLHNNNVHNIYNLVIIVGHFPINCLIIYDFISFLARKCLRKNRIRVAFVSGKFVFVSFISILLQDSLLIYIFLLSNIPSNCILSLGTLLLLCFSLRFIFMILFLFRFLQDLTFLLRSEVFYEGNSIGIERLKKHIYLEFKKQNNHT